MFLRLPRYLEPLHLILQPTSSQLLPNKISHSLQKLQLLLTRLLASLIRSHSIPLLQVLLQT